jgi:hypothetical protein
MPGRRDFEGVEIELPFFQVRMGEGGIHVDGSDDGEEFGTMDTFEEEHHIRRRVRRRLRFLRHLFNYLVLNAIFIFIDWSTGGEGNRISWAWWVAGIWGAFLAWEFVSTFVAPTLWGRDVEERWVEHEMRRRRNV